MQIFQHTYINTHAHSYTLPYGHILARTHTHAYIQELEGRLKKGEPCIIVFPKLHPHNEAKAYVMPYDQPEEIFDSEDDESTLMDLKEHVGSAVGGGGRRD